MEKKICVILQSPIFPCDTWSLYIISICIHLSTHLSAHLTLCLSNYFIFLSIYTHTYMYAEMYICSKEVNSFRIDTGSIWFAVVTISLSQVLHSFLLISFSTRLPYSLSLRNFWLNYNFVIKIYALQLICYKLLQILVV